MPRGRPNLKLYFFFLSPSPLPADPHVESHARRIARRAIRGKDVAFSIETSNIANTRPINRVTWRRGK